MFLDRTEGSSEVISKVKRNRTLQSRRLGREHPELQLCVTARAGRVTLLITLGERARERVLRGVSSGGPFILSLAASI